MPVSKTKPPEAIRGAYDAGVRLYVLDTFG